MQNQIKLVDKTHSNLLIRILFWIILGVLSTFFAEVISGNEPIVFFQSFGWTGVFPIYALHTLLLVYLAFKLLPVTGWISIRTIYLISTLFGMYEAYMTKVLWNPPWNAMSFRIGGVSFFEVLMLVFFWHAIMSFLVPVFWGENLLTSSSLLAESLNERFAKFVFHPTFPVILGVLGGIYLGTNRPGVGQAFSIALATTLLVSMFLLFWRLITNKNLYQWSELLPRKIEMIILGFLLAGYYLYYGFTLRPDQLPGYGAQFTVWLIYAALIALIILSRRRDQAAIKPEAEISLRQPLKKQGWKNWLLFSISFIVFSLVFSVLPDFLRGGLAAIAWLGGIGLGAVAIISSLVSLFRRNKKNYE